MTLSSSVSVLVLNVKQSNQTTSFPSSVLLLFQNIVRVILKPDILINIT